MKFEGTLVFGLCLSLMLAACSGGDDASSLEPQPLPPVAGPALLQNPQVKCGEWSQQSSHFPPPYVLAKHQRWVVMGSSSAFGAGASSYANSWAGKLTEYANAQGIEVFNIARGGYTTYHALNSDCEVNAARFQPDANHNINKALAFAPDLVVLSFPSNDAAMGYSAQETAYNLLMMREQLAQEKVATVLIGAQPRNMPAAKQRLLTQLDTLLQERMPACLVQVYEPLVDSGGNLAIAFNAGDGVHVNDAGHAIIYQRLLTALQEPDKGCVK